jgi:putative ABC transport system permease protein
MARSQGVDDRRLLVLSLMLANGLTALSGALVVQIQGFADVNMGTGTFVAGVGAVLLGELLLRPAGSKLLRITLCVLAGTLLYRFVLVAALRLGLPAADLRGATALTLLAAVAAQRWGRPFTEPVRLVRAALSRSPAATRAPQASGEEVS